VKVRPRDEERSAELARTEIENAVRWTNKFVVVVVDNVALRYWFQVLFFAYFGPTNRRLN
jgi:hypothetical protein